MCKETANTILKTANTANIPGILSRNLTESYK